MLSGCVIAALALAIAAGFSVDLADRKWTRLLVGALAADVAIFAGLLWWVVPR